MPSHRVLLVDDHADNLEIYRTVLEHFLPAATGREVDVECVLDGLSALEVLSERCFSLVITDVYMSVIRGDELVERIRSGETETGATSTSRNVPIIVLSADSMADDGIGVLGADLRLSKSCHPREVADEAIRLLT